MPVSSAPVIPKSKWRASPIPFDRGAQHRDLDRVGVGREALLDLGHDGVHVEGPRLRIHYAAIIGAGAL
jgi:hypothetical protein